MRKTLVIGTASVYAAAYVTLVFLFSPISFGAINLRVANILVGLVPLIGWPAIFGQALGVFIANSFSPLGPIDLVNSAPSFVFSWVIWRLRGTSVLLGLTLYSIALGLSVSFALNYAFGLPFIVEIPYVTGGIIVATTLLGYLFYRTVKKLGILQRTFGYDKNNI